MDDRIYTLMIGERAVLCFPAGRLQEAQTLLKEEWLRADLRDLKSNGKPVWDGREKLTVRNADEVETGRFVRESKTLQIADDDLPIVYLVRLY